MLATLVTYHKSHHYLSTFDEIFLEKKFNLIRFFMHINLISKE